MNRWAWLTSLVQEKEAAVATYRTVHKDRTAYSRYSTALLSCASRIDLILLSCSVASLPSISLTDTNITFSDKASDHHPIFCSFRLPCNPQYPPPPTAATRFRRLKTEEQKKFLGSIQTLEV